MSVNEYQEFEAINQKTSERNAQATVECHSTEEINRSKKAKAKKKAVAFMVVTLLALMLTMCGIVGLEMIGWINSTFQIVLMCLAGCAAMFKVGYFWHEIKQ